jgi:hypothetical protein
MHSDPAKQFTYGALRSQLQSALDAGYQFLSCEEYIIQSKENRLPKYTLVNRIDIDLCCKKAEKLANIFIELGVHATFFVRLHAPEYNPFDFENYRILKYIRDSGFEIGYHSEIVDQAAIWEESPASCLRRDIRILNLMLDIDIAGVASHGGLTGLNNLDFWADHNADEFGLLYEAYEKEGSFKLFDNSFYLSDSEWVRWKCYANGSLVEGDRRNITQHLADRHRLIYFLIHPDTYYERHIYE